MAVRVSREATLPVTDYSTTPASNIAISGINIAEACAAANINNAFRQLMADVRAMYNNLPDTTTFQTKAAAVFSGTQPIYTGRGAYLHHNNALLTSGKVFLQATGGAAPAMSPGDILLEY